MKVGPKKETLMHVIAHQPDPTLQMEMFYEIIKYRPDLDQKDSLGVTPLHLAAKLGAKEMVQALLKAGAKITRSNDNKNPLQLVPFWKASPKIHQSEFSKLSQQDLVKIFEAMEDTDNVKTLLCKMYWGEEHWVATRDDITWKEFQELLARQFSKLPTELRVVVYNRTVHPNRELSRSGVERGTSIIVQKRSL